MGAALFRSRPRATRTIILGLDAAGKTTLLYRLKLGQVVSTIPTIGFNVETISYENNDFVSWDVGGRSNLKGLWRHYFQEASLVIFVVDSNDKDRMPQAMEQLSSVLDTFADMVWSGQNKRMPTVLIYANKQDLPNAVPPEAIARQVHLHQISRLREHYPVSWKVGLCNRLL